VSRGLYLKASVEGGKTKWVERVARVDIIRDYPLINMFSMNKLYKP